MLSLLFFTILLVIGTIGLYYSILDVIKYEQERILNLSQRLGSRTLLLTMKLFTMAKLRKYHPCWWLGWLVDYVNDLQIYLHKRLLIKFNKL